VTEACPTRHCVCGRCYSPGSLLGDWLREQSWRARRLLLHGLLRRPERFPRDARGGVAVPGWVVELLGDQSWGTRYDEAR
jgi:hypothetical protein